MKNLLPVLILLLTTLQSTIIFGCEAGPDYKKPTIAERVTEASHIIIGTAVEINNKLNKKYGRAAQIKVKEWIKGNGSKTINIFNFGWGSDCKNDIPKNSSIFFISQIDSSNYRLNYLGIFDAVIEIDDTNLQELNEAIKQLNEK